MAGGCRSGAPQPAPDAAPSALVVGAPSPGERDAAAAAPSIGGRVRYTGARTDGVRAGLPRVPGCEQPAPEHALSVGPDGGLLGVVASVRAGGELPEAAPIVGRACGFEPRVSFLKAGGLVVAGNDDPILHTFHLRRVDGGRTVSEQVLAVPPGRGPLSLALPVAGRYRVESDHLAGALAWIVVLEEGPATLSAPDGSFDLTGLPAGPHEVTLWHEALGEELHRVDVPGDGPAALYVDWSDDAP